LSVFIKNHIGLKEAILFAEKYEEWRFLSTFVYEAGKEYYHHIHSGVANWGEKFLETAMETVYEQEKMKL
jgi:hypothetical protein